MLREKLQIHSLSSPSEAGGVALGMNLVRHMSTKTIRYNLNFYLCQMSEYTHTIYCQFCWFKRCSVFQSLHLYHLLLWLSLINTANS